MIAQADAAAADNEEDGEGEIEGLEDLETKEPDSVSDIMPDILSLWDIIAERARQEIYNATFRPLIDFFSGGEMQLIKYRPGQAGEYHQSDYITVIRKLKDFMKNLLADTDRYKETLVEHFTPDIINEITNNFIDEMRALRDKPPPPQRLISIPISRNLSFTGHQKILEDLYRMLPTHEYVNGSKVVLLQREEGVGKTEIALEFAWRTAADIYDGPVIWLQANSEQSLQMALKAAEWQLMPPTSRRIDGVVNIREIFSRVISKLSQSLHGRWLLVLDGLTKETADLFGPSIKKVKDVESTGCVLVTSRDMDDNTFSEKNDNPSRMKLVQKNPTELIKIPAMDANAAVALARNLLHDGRDLTASELSSIEQLARDCRYQPKEIKDAVSKTKITGRAYDRTDYRCLADLRTTDPRNDKKRIEETKGGLLADLYRWVLHNDDFQRWRDDGQSPLLWIKGDPGKGKTMLLCGIINELEKSITDTVASTIGFRYLHFDLFSAHGPVARRFPS
jgi:hypothetical protein